MKDRYKLIQWYPSLPRSIEEGDEVWRPQNPKAKPYWGYTTNSLACAGVDIPVEEVEDNPEFWEKVEVETDYEILSVKIGNPPQTGAIYTDVKEHPDYYLKQIKSGRNDIYSVKRLSDGEVFTIGGRVKSSVDGSKFTIAGFEIDHEYDGGLKILVRDATNMTLTASSIGSVEHNKPVLTTVDGVDIYKGDKYYHVCDGMNIHKSTCNGGAYTESYLNKTFYSKDRAEQFVENNKPLYSREDILNAIRKSAIISCKDTKINLDAFEKELDL